MLIPYESGIFGKTTLDMLKTRSWSQASNRSMNPTSVICFSSKPYYKLNLGCSSSFIGMVVVLLLAPCHEVVMFFMSLRSLSLEFWTSFSVIWPAETVLLNICLTSRWSFKEMPYRFSLESVRLVFSIQAGSAMLLAHVRMWKGNELFTSILRHLRR